MNEYGKHVDDYENLSGTPADRRVTQGSVRSRLNESSPKHSEKERTKNKVPHSAIAAKPFKTPNPNFLTFQKGDVVESLETTKDKGVWVGTHSKTRQRGCFNEEYFNFSEELVDPINESSSSQPQQSETVQYISSQEVHEKRNSKGFQQSDENGKRITKNQCIMVLIVSVFAVLVASRFSTNATLQRRPTNITELRNTFKSQDLNMWDSLKAGLTPSRTEGVKTFLFLHSSIGPTVECLIKKLSDNACVVRRASDIYNDDDYVTKLRIDLEEQKCMVIYDLEKLHPDGVVVLKGFCDAYNPIVPNSEFYFALNAGHRGLEKNLNKAAREILESTWSQQLSHDDFAGTVTRLTQNVLKVSKEEKLPCKTHWISD